MKAVEVFAVMADNAAMVNVSVVQAGKASSAKTRKKVLLLSSSGSLSFQ